MTLLHIVFKNIKFTVGQGYILICIIPLLSIVFKKKPPTTGQGYILIITYPPLTALEKFSQTQWEERV